MNSSSSANANPGQSIDNLRRKPRVCFTLPGVNYRAHVPYVLVILPILPYLQQDFDITLAFRTMFDEVTMGYPCISIVAMTDLPQEEQQSKRSYFSPDNYLGTWKYGQALARFAKTHATNFDVVIEYEWPMLGLLGSMFRRLDVPTLPVIEAEFNYLTDRRSLYSPRELAKQAFRFRFQETRQMLRRRWIRQSPGLIVETVQMQQFLQRQGWIHPEMAVYPISMGIQPDIFHPRDRQQCRQILGIPAEDYVLTYIGSLNRFIQEPAPLIAALGQEAPLGVTLHLVGDGAKQAELEALAQQVGAAAIFHGRLPQSEAASYIAAADLCVAPYDASRYYGGEMTSASLKVPEYLASHRPVLTIPCDRMRHLLQNGRYGFLVENQVDAYRTFFRSLPPLSQLRAMEQTIQQDHQRGYLQENHIVLDFANVATLYHQAIWETLQRQPRFAAVSEIPQPLSR